MYIVLEIQTSSTVAALINTYDNRNDAESKYHQILSSAALSAIPKHSAVLMNDVGETLKMDSYTHEVEINE